MSLLKVPLSCTVLEASQHRAVWALQNFPRVCVSFSGGKDSTVMLHITALLAREMGKKISVLFIDWEAQFSSTIAHCKRMRDLYKDVIDDFYWVAIPLTTQNALTQFEPEWQCWEPGAQWVRQPLKARLPTRHFSLFTVLAVLLKALSRALQSGFRNSARPPFWWVSAPMNPTIDS